MAGCFSSVAENTPAAAEIAAAVAGNITALAKIVAAASGITPVLAGAAGTRYIKWASNKRNAQKKIPGMYDIPEVFKISCRTFYTRQCESIDDKY